MAAPGTVQPVNPTTKADTRQLDNAVPPIDEHTKRERERFLRELEMKGSKATYDRLKEHIGRMDADSIRRVQGHVDTGAQSGNVQGLNDALHGFADMLDGAHRRGGGDDRRFNKIFQVEFDAMETDQADRLRRMGIEVNAETMFFAMVQTMSSPGWGQYRKFLEKISAETLKSHDAARMMMNGALVAAVLLDNELEKRKKQKEAGEEVVRDEERRDRVPASQMAGIMGEQDLVDKLGLSAEEAKDVVAAVQRNPQFIDLVDAKTANTVMTLAIAKTVAERMGAQVDEKAQEQGVKDRAA